jgi:hypothetical protein
MINDEKGASKSEMRKPGNTASKIEKNQKKAKEESSGSKNASILDFLGTGKEIPGLSNKKRKRSVDERENSDSDKEERKLNVSKLSKARKEIVNLLDDSLTGDVNPKANGDLSSSSPAKKKKINKNRQSSLDSKSNKGNLENAESKQEKKKKNRETCSICRVGGDLLLCDNCPKSFHTECLKMKSNEVPELEWYCPGCM